MREYDLIAEWYASERVDQTGVPEAQALAQSVSHGGQMLDIGCGNGIPITRTLLRTGHRVVGLDSAGEMLRRFQRNCPTAAVVRGIVQACPFADASFVGAVAWGVMFHLPLDEQIAAVASVARILMPGAPFLFTSGERDDSAHNDMEDGAGKEDTMNGVTFRYFSFSRESYRRILDQHGFVLRDVHSDTGGNTYYLAEKAS
jgi:ubiquinone/menaquinone biosynthesis C-methylase UbiE